jgi:hypothetical protein
MKKLIIILSLIATSAIAQDVTVRLRVEQYAAVNALVLAHNAAVEAFNANTNNTVKQTNITHGDVLLRYADRLVMIAANERKSAIVAKFEKATEPQKVAIEAEADKVSIGTVPIAEPIIEPENP